MHECGHCRTEFVHGATACKGCLGTIVYGPSHQEKTKAVQLGTLLGIILSFLALTYLPYFINQTFGLSIPLFWGIDILPVLTFILLTTMTCAYIAKTIIYKLYDSRIRTFR